MHNLATRETSFQAVQEYGKIVGIENEFYRVETGSGPVSVKRAVSCLVKPEMDDMVLVYIGSLGDGYILAVLEREPEAKTTLSFDADVDITTLSGRMAITANEGVNFASGKDIDLISTEINVHASKGLINIGRLSLLGTLFEGQIDRIKVVADHVESFLKRFFQRSEQSFRKVERLDHVEAGRMNYKAKQSMQLRGEFAQMTASEDVHIDGKRINIG
jgi:hypothetical protein